MRETIIQKVLDKKLIAIVRGVYGEDCLNLAKALHAGGIEMMEVTFDQSHPEKLAQTSDTVKLLCENLGDKMFFGAGTVTTTEMVQLAEDAGAQFIVSPDTNEAVIRKAVADGLVSMPGAFTPTEIMQAHSFGADFVKLFPASALGASYLKAIRAPISHVRILAVGGVNEQNLKSFLDAGAVGAGVGGNLVNKAWIAAGEFEKLTEAAKAFTSQL